MEVEKKKSPSKSKALKKMIPQLLISVSLFSFLVSYSSSLSSSSSPKLHLYFSSANEFQLLSKNWLFLICNGLLVFLSKTSGLFINHPPHDVLHFRISDTTYEFQQNADDGGGKNPEQVSILIGESDHDEKPQKDDHQNQPDSSSCWLFDHDLGDDLYGHHHEEDEEDDDNDDDEEMMSTEELNQKFEDFIRKMKEEIIVNEATHKLLLLN